MQNYLDKKDGKFLICYLSGHDAGYRDLNRIKIILNNSSCITRISSYTDCTNILKTIDTFTNFLFIHSSPYNIVLLVLIKIFKGNESNLYFLVHNSPKFESRKNLILNLFDKLILRVNLIIFNNFVFLTKHVSDSWPNFKNKIYLTSKEYVLPVYREYKFFKKSSPTFFFFGRYLEYKNIELILKVSKFFINNTFHIYSYDCPYKSFDNVIIDSSWQDNDVVDRIYLQNDILILPYLEATQSGPLYLGIEHSKLIVLSNILEFENYKNYSNIIFFEKLNINSLIDALEISITKFKKL